ncbi:Zinc finger, RING-CH-type [Dillenia turbinata]|uniref:Zinc finger, RING-CH-type n=1 Tax=Dillenia turbinata TaxID=194707 RepID=A0AAN8Z5Q0_9MAGN
MGEENQIESMTCDANHDGCSPSESEDLLSHSGSCHSSDKETSLVTCRVCQCLESDKRGDAALGFLGITPPIPDTWELNAEKHNHEKVLKDGESNDSVAKKAKEESNFVEFISPQGEVFICKSDIETGPCHPIDTLVELGCSCKKDLALIHYACALKWFVNHGSTICEICGCVAKNIRSSDFKKVVSSLKDYEMMRERTVSGEPNPIRIQENPGVDPDAIAAVRRQRLSEISLWFNPSSHTAVAAAQVGTEQSLDIVNEDAVTAESPATKWAVEGTGILLATGLLTVTLAWLIAPRVGKKTAKNGLHILLGGICALTVVVFFRFFVLARIKYGPARYWAILFVFWFLVFGIWASRTHGAHAT